MIAFDEALRRLTDEAAPLGSIEVELEQAQGHVLAERVSADRDFPPTDRSAMDGFAVRAADLGEDGGTLELIGEVRAGQATGNLEVGRRQAARIMTGAVVPPGADTVVMVERCEEQQGERTVTVRGETRRGQHIRRRGEDLLSGAVVLEPGTPLQPPEIAALASVGWTKIRVFRPPVVHVLSTGDEIVEPDRSPADHQVRNSNAWTLRAQLREMAIEGRYLGIASDDRGRLDEMIGQGLSGDVLLITGGVSVGDYDLVGESLEAAGMRLLFHKIDVKPGKPVLAGRCGSCLVVGLPGNPVSTFTGFALLVAPALRRMRGYDRWRNVELEVVLQSPLRAKPGRPTYHLVRLEAVGGALTARPLASRGSGDVLSLSRANGFVRTPADCRGLDRGARAPALAWRDFHLRGGGAQGRQGR